MLRWDHSRTRRTRGVTRCRSESLQGSFNFEIVSRLPEAERDRKPTALEALLNLGLEGAASLQEYQRRLYALTDELNELEFFL